MGLRRDLSAELHEICSNVYFQPPTNIQLVYPCILYSKTTIRTKYANDNPYILQDEYSLLYITRDPDDENVRKIARLKSCSAGRFYTADNLYHYPYTIVY